MYIQDSITVVETHDEDGDLEYLLSIRTHSRTIIDLLAETFGVTVEFLREEVRDNAE